MTTQVLTDTQLEELWIEAKGPANDAAVAAAVARAESGGDPTQVDNTAYPDRPYYHAPGKGALPEYSVGLWQINVLAHPSYSPTDLLNPRINAAAAVAISNSGADFGRWTTYTDGAYKAYLAAAQKALGTVPAPVRVSAKPIVKPWITLPALPSSTGVDVPASVTRSVTGVWQAIGSHLPHAINRNKAARKAMLRMAR